MASRDDGLVTLDIDVIPEMEVVKETGDLELEDADTSAESSSTDSDPSNAPQPVKGNVAPARNNYRRTRGLSFLPIKSMADTPNSNPTVGSPPKTPSSVRSLDSNKLSPFVSLPSANTTPGMPTKSPRPSLTPDRSIATPDHVRRSSDKTKNSPLVDQNQQSLSAYFSQLASKEAKLSTIRAHLASLQQESKDAETDMAEFKKNGAKLAQLVNDAHDFNSSPEPSMSHPTAKLAVNRRSSVSSNNSIGSTKSQDEAQKDVIGMGRRVVGEINSQFWAFLDDVKSATMGNVEFDHSDRQHNERPQERQPEHSHEHPPQLPPRRSPSPQRLSPKRSIQDFMRSHSPTRESIRRFRSDSPTRQERREHAAHQEKRSTERLTKKLSHIDSRAPPTPRRPPSPASDIRTD